MLWIFEASDFGLALCWCVGGVPKLVFKNENMCFVVLRMDI